MKATLVFLVGCSAAPARPSTPPAPAIATTTCAILDVAYPMRVPIAGAAEIDARIAAFRAQGSATWDQVTLDATGLAHVISTHDPAFFDAANPTLTARERSAVTALAIANPDVFGTRDCDVQLVCAASGLGCDVVPSAGARGGIGIVKETSSIVIGGGLLRIPAIPARRIDDATARAPAVAMRYSVYVPAGRHPVGDTSCQPPRSCAHTVEITAMPENLVVRERVMCVQTPTDLTVRRVLGVNFDPAALTSAESEFGQTTDRPPSVAPEPGSPRLPIYTDAVTGERLDGTVFECP